MLMFCIHENRAIILGIKTGKPLETLAVFGLQSFRPHVLAEDEGFEPPQTESESGVLPLHKSSKLCIAVQRLLLYTNSWKSQVLFPLFFIFLCAAGGTGTLGSISPSSFAYTGKGKIIVFSFPGAQTKAGVIPHFPHKRAARPVRRFARPGGRAAP